MNGSPSHLDTFQNGQTKFTPKIPPVVARLSSSPITAIAQRHVALRLNVLHWSSDRHCCKPETYHDSMRSRLLPVCFALDFRARNHLNVLSSFTCCFHLSLSLSVCVCVCVCVCAWANTVGGGGGVLLPFLGSNTAISVPPPCFNQISQLHMPCKYALAHNHWHYIHPSPITLAQSIP